MPTPEVNSAESFGLSPGEVGYDTFTSDFPEGNSDVPAALDFQDRPVQIRRIPLVKWDDIEGRRWMEQVWECDGK